MINDVQMCPCQETESIHIDDVNFENVQLIVIKVSSTDYFTFVIIIVYQTFLLFIWRSYRLYRFLLMPTIGIWRIVEYTHNLHIIIESSNQHGTEGDSLVLIPIKARNFFGRVLFMLCHFKIVLKLCPWPTQTRYIVALRSINIGLRGHRGKHPTL